MDPRPAVVSPLRGARRWLLALLLLALVAACGGADTGAGTATDDDDGDTAADTDGDTTADGEPLRVAFVYVGPPGDAGWTFQHDQGRQAVEEEFGDAVEVTFLESIPGGPEAERVLEDLARQGNDLIFATSFGHMEPMAAVSERFPDVAFEHATGYMTTDNMGNYFGAAEEGRYLEGMAAGAATETGEIGYVAAFPIPEVVRGINAYTLGARAVNPDATVRVVWTSTWYDPEVEGQAAQSLLDAGADVLGQHQDSPATGQAAAEAGAAWTGYNSDLERFAPEAWLTSTVWNWAPYYIDRVRAVMDGTWAPESYYGDMAGGMVDLAPFGERVDEEARAQIEERKQEIIDGTFAPFRGPVVDQDGTERVAEGEEMTLEELLSMDFFVEGVIGDIPS
jgi:basic membrane protein A and related proteins